MYFPIDYFPPPPPPKPTASSLGAKLLDAVYAQDVPAARKIFDTAFWEKIELKPDSFTLLQSTLRGDRAMVSLLTSYGATFDDKEVILARKMATPENWARIEGPLKQAGIRTNFSETESRRGDIATSIKWAHRAAAEAKARGQQDAGRIQIELDLLLSATLIDYVQNNEIQKAKDVLLYRDAKLGDGRTSNPLDVAAEFRAIERRYPLSNARAGLLFLDRLSGAGLVLKPLVVEQIDLMFAAPLVAELDKRGLLAGSTMSARRDTLHKWLTLTQHIKLGERVHDLGAEFVEHRRGELKAALQIMLKKNPADDADADWFIRQHREALKTAPAIAQNVEKQLLAMGYFDGPGWTAPRLRELANAGDENFALKDIFNTRAARKELSETALPKLLNPKKFSLVIEAMGPFGWKPTADDTVKILDYLHGETRKSGMTVEAQSAVTALRNVNADFSAVDPNRYLGKKEPGLAKALVDAGVVKVTKFDFENLLDRSGNLEKSLLKFDTNNKYAEFLFQLLLEQIDPDKYVPLRASPAKNYQQLFLTEWVNNLEPKFKDKFPPQPPRRGTNSSGPR